MTYLLSESLKKEQKRANDLPTIRIIKKKEQKRANDNTHLISFKPFT